MRKPPKMCCQLWLEGFGTGGCTPSTGEGSVSGSLGAQGGAGWGREGRGRPCWGRAALPEKKWALKPFLETVLSDLNSILMLLYCEVMTSGFSAPQNFPCSLESAVSPLRTSTKSYLHTWGGDTGLGTRQCHPGGHQQRRGRHKAQRGAAPPSSHRCLQSQRSRTGGRCGTGWGPPAARCSSCWGDTPWATPGW